jgi:hypothetical protein
MRRIGRSVVVCLWAWAGFAETIPVAVPVAGERARSISHDEPFAPQHGEDLSSDPHVREMMRMLWRAAGLGTTCWERAAWIVRNEDGSYSCVQVPPSRECFRLTLSSERPEGAVALMHTHPSKLGAMRIDEGNDANVAEKIGLPLYTIGAAGLFRYDPVTNVERRIEHGLSWMNTAANDSCSCEVQTPREIRMAKVRAASKRNLEAARASVPERAASSAAGSP